MSTGLFARMPLVGQADMPPAAHSHPSNTQLQLVNESAETFHSFLKGIAIL